ASGYGSTVAGGEDSTASGVGAFVGGGGYDGGTFQGNMAGGNASTIGGGVGNSIQSGANESFIGGGIHNSIQVNLGYSAVIGGGVNNTNAGQESSIVGGAYNIILSPEFLDFIGGGFINQLGGTNRLSSVVLVPGQGNVIGGGGGNAILQGSIGGFIGSGLNNTMQTNTEFSVVDGGQFNTIQANVTNSIILGGANNQVSASDSVAAGQNAVAANASSFVWNDGSAPTASIVTNSVTFRASGGYRFFTGNSTAGAQLAANATAWSVLSDRNAKKNIAPVNYEAVLDKLARVPVEQWNYKWEKDGDTPNLGPMAQDFKAAFFPGRDDKSISTLEFDGVELAAIQGLNQKLDEKDAELQKLKQQNETLEKRLDNLEQVIKSITDKN
ncbi:MAG TPA: tail fiber domain-containing protein, partial [Verrucomicrobiae bacterium]|nr:tail fiber domain-containing protein [Verrucomicrobiae bacterium]